MITVELAASPYGVITILRNSVTGAYAYEQDACTQSEADSNGVSLAPYIHAFFDLLQQAQAQRVLMIGGGGGTLATLLYRAGTQVTVLDTNAKAFALARTYFQLPTDVDCVVADGAEYLMRHNTVFDAIVLDAYVGNRIPPHLCSNAFLKLVESRLDKNSGAFFANVHTGHDFDLSVDKFSRSTSQVWRNVRLLDASGRINRNAILMAGAVGNLKKPKMRVWPDTFTEELEFELNRLEFRSCRLEDSHRSNAGFRRLAAHQANAETPS